jgi:hypothetical protein
LAQTKEIPVKYELQILEMDETGLLEDSINSDSPIPIPPIGAFILSGKAFHEVAHLVYQFSGDDLTDLSVLAYCKPVEPKSIPFKH